MRKREIHSVAHWAMMFLLLMFPLLMVGISTFGNEQKVVNESYQYETNEVSTADDLVVGNIYKVNSDEGITDGNLFYASFIQVDYSFTFSFTDTDNTHFFILQKRADGFVVAFAEIGVTGSSWFNYPSVFTSFDTIYFVYYANYYNNLPISSVSASDYLGEHYVNVSGASYKDDVNNWVDSFLDLPVNAWYKSLMNTVGVGFTNSSIMNVIYAMPVYILWVFLFDVIVDCFLVIIKLPHKLLNRLSGGENE